MTSDWFDLLFRASWQGGMLLLLVLPILFLLGKRLSANVRYLLLAVILLRFLLPCTPSSDTSLFGLAKYLSTTQFGIEQPVATESIFVSLSDDRDINTTDVSTPLLSQGFSDQVFDVEQHSWVTSPTEVPEIVETSSHTTFFENLLHVVMPWKYVVIGFWCIGTLFFATRLMRNYFQLLGRRKLWKIVELPKFKVLFEQCRRQVGLRRPIKIYSTTEPVGAASCGIFRPTIVLSEDMFESFDQKELHLVLLHEMLHHKRLDPLTHLLAQTARLLHWINPAAWLLFRRMETERELAVDQAVLQIAGTESATMYGNVVLRAVGIYRHAVLSPALLGFQSQDEFLERRIRMIIKPQHTTWIRFSVGLLLVFGLAATGLTDVGREKNLESVDDEAPPILLVNEKKEEIPEIPPPAENRRRVKEKNRWDELVWETIGIRFTPVPKERWEEISKKHGVDYTHGGVIVDEIREESEFAKKGVQSGDIIVGIHTWRTASKNDIRFIAKWWRNQVENELEQLLEIEVLLLREGQLYRGKLSVTNNAETEPEARTNWMVWANRKNRASVVCISGDKVGAKSGNGMGTGIVVDPQGYIITNHHIIESLREIRVMTHDRKKYAATLVARDAETDLAIIKIKPDKPIKPAAWGCSKDLILGELCMAIGNPYGYDFSIADGRITGIGREIAVNDSLSYRNVIQTSTPINPGDSGGPLINVNGEIIGMIVAIRHGATNIGFAIPIDLVADVVAKLMDEVPERKNHPDPNDKTSSKTGEDEIVADVRIVGNDQVQTKDIAKVVKTEKGKPFDELLLEDDKRTLMQKGWFLDVKPKTEKTPDGFIVTFHLIERPILHYVKIVGNKSIERKDLLEKAGLKPGEVFDPIVVQTAKERIETFYRETGNQDAQVVVLSGDQTTDRGVIFLVSEGQQQHILGVEFEGNTTASSARLKALVQLEPKFFLRINSDFTRKKLDEAAEKITKYYRDLGFPDVKVKQEYVETEGLTEKGKDNHWIKVKFIIEEGTRQKSK